ncbi:MAG: c-type cytochrome biogenesis protein CcmI [Alphaproteobacteria bacterium HGW-Alphaproteobacteria-2]|nr:MAG: c-type cytochrome biogenesis protein CcmI [Alphaproteobacteria bacterium HGW-Alphaproteobacteria-2]
MGFWLTAIGLAALAALALVAALLRGREGVEPVAAFDLRVYRAQLSEVERDLARGVLSPEDAERARVEISRRILEADRTLKATGAAPAGARRGDRLLGVAVALAVVAGSVALYGHLGAPGAADLPLGERLAALDAQHAARPGQAAAEAATGAEAEETPEGMDAEYRALVEQLRTLVAQRPNDAEGNAILARHEAAMGRFRAAHAAQARAIAAMAAGGYVSPEAEAALSAALARNPRQPLARYYAGLMFAQAGRHDRAFDLWRGLLAESRESAPWVPLLRERLPVVAELAGRWLDPALLQTQAAAVPGPSATEMEAAAGMSDEDRNAMIRGMVDGLEARLVAEGGTAAEWARLIRALGVLGDATRAEAARASAEAAHDGDAAALATIRAAARDAGLGG